MITVEPIPGAPDACLLASAGLGCTLRIDGISAPDMAWRLHRQGQAWSWTDRAGAPKAIRVRLQRAGGGGTDESQANQGPIVERDLVDGHVRLHSGGLAEVRILAHHVDGDTILPTSLYLALAHQWAQAGILPLHAAAILSPDGGILVTGNKGAGKSTLAAAALAVGWPVLTDDWLLLKASENAVVASRIRDFMMLRDSWATNVLTEQLDNTRFVQHRQRPKQTLRFADDDRRFVKDCEITALWSLRRPRTGRKAQSLQQPLARTDIMAAMIEFSMPLLFSSLLPFERSQLVRTAEAITRRIPGWQLQTGTDLAIIPGATLGGLARH